MTTIPCVSVAYVSNGASTKANALGMRPMQERAREEAQGGDGMTGFVQTWPNEGIVQQAVGQMLWAASPDTGFVQEALARLNNETRS